MDTKPQKVIYLVRHGQSVGNAAPVFQPADSPLSEVGKNQAMAIANRLHNIEFDKLIASPLPRTYETARVIASKSAKKIEFSNLLVERKKPSELDGKPYADEPAKKLYAEWEKSLYDSGERVSDGENFDDLVARADAALAYLLARPEQKLVVVTHSIFLRTMVARVLLSDTLTGPVLKYFMRHTSVENTAITVLKHMNTFYEPAPAWHLWTLNDHSHFAD